MNLFPGFCAERITDCVILSNAPAYRFWCVHFHITIVQILANVLKNFKMEDILLLTDAVLNFEMTCNITASFFNRPQVKKDNGYMKVYRPKSTGSDIKGILQIFVGISEISVDIKRKVGPTLKSELYYDVCIHLQANANG